ncbi:tripartite tricarboxylate transporter substrate binding protein [Arthrobacter sp. StoSoilB22]|uniref:tripartite tricarboxylate transporter substrate binding protein n=1 Tax=Arthrobacter sp. StoSoilB22 TaxID=2830996 RepID=UPI001CC64D14|nr:tripartite tricarboxylate transporter substrate binding protein [Arthrobacter sp. StoSoilB22]BCW62834.1 C4-dicarboxylate ABC transporter substrate-binding protein [Arthrobacter sp. StoSoilB22]
MLVSSITDMTEESGKSMKITPPRRRLLAGSGAAIAAAIMLTGCGPAATNPNQNTASSVAQELTIDAPSGPGSGYDQTARALEKSLKSENLSKKIEVRNTQGAGGTVALSNFTQKTGTKDLMLGGLSLVGATITNSAPNKLSDLTPIARLIGEYEVIVVPAESPHKSLNDFLTALKSNPGANPIAIGNQGGIDHIWGGKLVQNAGVRPTEVNFVTFSGGGEALVALLGNKVSAGIAGYGEFADQVEAGKLRILAVSSDKPLDLAPDAPTVVDAGYADAVLVNWRGIFAPPGVSDADRKALSDVFAKLSQSSTWKETLKTNGWSDQFLDSDKFAADLEEQQTSTQEILTTLGLK